MASTHHYIDLLPKIELHVHIEGTLTPRLRWALAKKNKIPLKYLSYEELLGSYATMYNHRKELLGDNGLPTFLEAYYGGMEVLRTENDFYDLAMDYFRRVQSMNVRYAEPFFDLQAHTRRGVAVETVMKGLRQAKSDAPSQLGVHCNWIMCFLRDMSPASAMEAYEAALQHRDVFCAVGLDSNEYDRPPSLFENVFRRARSDGFKVTSHCDVGQKDTHAHIRQVLTSVAGSGADRIDHGLNAAEDPELIHIIRDKGVGMTLCPHAYHRRLPTEYVFPLVRRLFDAGIKITINSDDPTYMHDMWVTDNLKLVQKHCRFDMGDMATLQRHAVDICWADESQKEKIRGELEVFEKSHGNP